MIMRNLLLPLSYELHCSWLMVLLMLAASSSISNGLVQQQTTIQVCQNKDCCKRYQQAHNSMDLVQTFRDLLAPSTITINSSQQQQQPQFVVEASGCLSHCGSGPNVAIITPDGSSSSNNQETVHNHVETPTSAAAILPVEPHPTLLAAVTVMEKAHKATETDKKLHLLNSVINKLNSIPELAESAANVHAHTLRAQVHLETSNNHSVELAMHDIQQAIAMNAKNQLLPLPANAWRILADAQEQSGNIPAAMAALRQWAQLNPSYATKVAKEVSRLQQQL
ncbi:expressed unknown protein [Seminavis robusta]|uniref:Uncharacterized protein n=1 Tax=Seminavis robusta TaxID=568900 RepID=A0A9N8DVN8_9STRA|nr:expressed unknown protein [Seminavis robusta]|eukprot:Sro310_g114010.1 n/a (280) ;mRNA; f:22611-23709